MDPKPELAFGRVSAVPAAGRTAAALLAFAVRVSVTQVLYGAETVHPVLGAAARLHRDPRDTLEEASSVTALHGRGTLAVVYALVRC